MLSKEVDFTLSTQAYSHCPMPYSQHTSQFSSFPPASTFPNIFDLSPLTTHFKFIRSHILLSHSFFPVLPQPLLGIRLLFLPKKQTDIIDFAFPLVYCFLNKLPQQPHRYCRTVEEGTGQGRNYQRNGCGKSTTC